MAGGAAPFLFRFSSGAESPLEPPEPRLAVPGREPQHAISPSSASGAGASAGAPKHLPPRLYRILALTPSRPPNTLTPSRRPAQQPAGCPLQVPDHARDSRLAARSHVAAMRT